MLKALTVVALILPLAIDTFVLGTALGAAGLGRKERLRTSLVLTGFEAGMPLVGFLIGAGVGHFIGRFADYFAAAVLAAAGLWMLRPGAADDEEEEEQRVRLLQTARGWSIVVLGLSISLDELAIGFGVGLLRLPLAILVVLIAIQAFLAGQLGMRLGACMADSSKEIAERLAGVLLVLAAVLIVAEKLFRI
ncbi:MAG: manganese efflux pump MntP family protein [bacterium]